MRINTMTKERKTSILALIIICIACLLAGCATKKKAMTETATEQETTKVEQVNRYDVKGKRYIGTPLKYYFSDLGLRNALLNFRQVEKTHLMENLIYNELRGRGYNVDVGVVPYNGKNAQGVSFRTQLEVDFVCNKGSQRLYVQSALALPTQEKIDQETKSLRRIDDGFQKMVTLSATINAE